MSNRKRSRKRLTATKKRKRERGFPGVKFDSRIDSLSVPELLVEAVKYAEDFPDAPMTIGIKNIAIRVSNIDKKDRMGFAHIAFEDAVEMLRCLLSIAQDNPTCKIGFADFGTSEPVCQIGGNSAEECDHEWVVFSTALNEGCLMVQCVICGAHGSVDDPAADEWNEAFYAPSNPYRWMDYERVNIRGVLPPDKWYVGRSEDQSPLDDLSPEEGDR